jgi:hypothetical protein
MAATPAATAVHGNRPPPRPPVRRCTGSSLPGRAGRYPPARSEAGFRGSDFPTTAPVASRSTDAPHSSSSHGSGGDACGWSTGWVAPRHGAHRHHPARRRGAVGVLLVHDDVDDTRQAWFGPWPEHSALTKQELEDMGVTDTSTARLVDVTIRAAAGTGAGIRIVPSPGGPLEGLGAILRWSPGT